MLEEFQFSVMVEKTALDKLTLWEQPLKMDRL